MPTNEIRLCGLHVALLVLVAVEAIRATGAQPYCISTALSFSPTFFAPATKLLERADVTSA